MPQDWPGDPTSSCPPSCQVCATCSIFTVPRRMGTGGPTWISKYLNMSIKSRHFRMKTLLSIADSLQPHNADLTESLQAYWIPPMLKPSRLLGGNQQLELTTYHGWYLTHWTPLNLILAFLYEGVIRGLKALTLKWQIIALAMILPQVKGISILWHPHMWCFFWGIALREPGSLHGSYIQFSWHLPSHCLSHSGKPHWHVWGWRHLGYHIHQKSLQVRLTFH